MLSTVFLVFSDSKKGEFRHDSCKSLLLVENTYLVTVVLARALGVGSELTAKL